MKKFLPQTVVSHHKVEELWTVQQLAKFVNKSPSTIYSDIGRRPEALPQILRIPGSGRPLFVNPREWASGLLAEQMVAKGLAVATTVTTTLKPQRGRPSNLELARRKAEAETGGAK